MMKPCSDRVLLERRRIVEREMIVFCGFELELGGNWGSEDLGERVDNYCVFKEEEERKVSGARRW